MLAHLTGWTMPLPDDPFAGELRAMDERRRDCALAHAADEAVAARAAVISARVSPDALAVHVVTAMRAGADRPDLAVRGRGTAVPGPALPVGARAGEPANCLPRRGRRPPPAQRRMGALLRPRHPRPGLLCPARRGRALAPRRPARHGPAARAGLGPAARARPWPARSARRPARPIGTNGWSASWPCSLGRAAGRSTTSRRPGRLMGELSRPESAPAARSGAQPAPETQAPGRLVTAAAQPGRGTGGDIDARGVRPPDARAAARPAALTPDTGPDLGG